MRRAVARGRMFPQSYSTDRRYGRLSLKAVGLFPLMWSNADDQGRLCGDPEEIKYAVCPNIDHITKQDIPALLKELQDNKLILRYDAPKSAAIQMLDWWDANNKMQWAWPSDYQPPEGWQDHIRCKKDAKTMFTLNWPVSGEDSGEEDLISQVRTQVSGKMSSGENSGESSGEPNETSPLTTPSYKDKNIKRRVNRRGRGNSPEDSGEEPSPSPVSLSGGEKEIFDNLVENFRMGWGRLEPPDYKKIKPRKLGYRERAMLRDLAIELYAAGGCKAAMIKKAFSESASSGKPHISYVRAVLLDWKGVPRKLGNGT